MKSHNQDLLRSLPSVSAMLEHAEVCEWLHEFSRRSVVAVLQAAIQERREAIVAGSRQEPVELEELIARAEVLLLERSRSSLRRVINATGIVLHTGLGRAPLSDAAVSAIAETAGGYCNLEYDVCGGRRGQRNTHVADHLTALTGASAATVVNNNAAATLLILRSLAAGREVITSRGQLIEIGGGFRLPDIMRASGATLREVGTTNRTRLSDYEQAIGDSTAMLLRVHPSNYRVVGFTEEVPISALAKLAHQHALIAVDDLGSGALFDLSACGLPHEPWVGESIAAGADLVCFSGDKLLGGPQCGLIVGRKDLVARIESDPLMRTYRVDKLVLLALEATLQVYRDSPDAGDVLANHSSALRSSAIRSIPTLAMLTISTDELGKRARTLAEQLEAAVAGEHFYVCSDVGYAGGGSLPARELETVLVQWRPARVSVEMMGAALRDSDVPIIARIRNDVICFDVRTVPESDFETLVASVSAALKNVETSERQNV